MIVIGPYLNGILFMNILTDKIKRNNSATWGKITINPLYSVFSIFTEYKNKYRMT